MLKTKKNLELQLFGEELTAVQQAKLLGVILDQKLTFNAHINENAKKRRQCHGLLKLLSGAKWGCKPKTSMKLYTFSTRILRSSNSRSVQNEYQETSNNSK